MAEDAEAEAWRLVRTPLGEHWSGRTRYAAAMTLYNAGRIGADVLEVYRICARLDHADPVVILRDRGIGADWIDALAKAGEDERLTAT